MAIRDFFDEREEVIFWILLVLTTVAVPLGYLSGLEAVGADASFYALLLGSKAHARATGGSHE